MQAFADRAALCETLQTRYEAAFIHHAKPTFSPFHVEYSATCVLLFLSNTLYILPPPPPQHQHAHILA